MMKAFVTEGCSYRKLFTFEVIWKVWSYRHWSQVILSLRLVVARAVESRTVKKSMVKVSLRASLILEVY